jgi:inhibitor of KinA sporulation pathway (predicted exonuclease)
MKYNIINIVDIEATCWGGDKPHGSMSEIIEIGITELEISSGSILSSASIYIEPKFSKVSDYCFKLTGITQELLDNSSMPFYKAVEYGHLMVTMIEECSKINLIVNVLIILLVENILM